MMFDMLQNKEDYEAVRLKDKSVSIEIKMVIDDAKIASPFIKMFTIDDFRDIPYKDIEKTIFKRSKHILQTYSHVLLNHPDCLNGQLDENTNINTVEGDDK